MFLGWQEASESSTATTDCLNFYVINAVVVGCLLLLHTV